MSDQNPLMNIGDLARPVNTLIEKISEAVEGIAKPAQVVRMAKADAEAKKILAITDIEISELNKREMTRFILEESRKQENMESILSKALPEVTQDAHPEQMNKDWISHFFERSRLISDDDMQILWANVLAGQANAPGRYSKKTIDILASLEQIDAVLFAQLARYCVVTMNESICPLIYEYSHEIYARHGMRFPQLSHLESLGLIHLNTSGAYRLGNTPNQYTVCYFDSFVQLTIPETTSFRQTNVFEPSIFETGKVMLTKSGEELVGVCDVEPVDDFLDYLLNKWTVMGYSPEIISNLSDSDETASFEDDIPF